MVGHSGNLAAAIKAVETVDAGLGKIADAIERSGGALLVTADHGNCEMMRDPATGGPHTSHTMGPVPLLLQVAATCHWRMADWQMLPDIARPYAIAETGDMTGVSLLRPQKRS